MRIKNQKDFASGLMFMGIGLVFAVGTLFYDVGSASHMGPGYFPLLLGVLLTALGVAIALQAVVLKTGAGEGIGSWAWRPLVYILGANFVFGILLTGSPGLGLPTIGMIVGIYVLTLIASLASSQFKIREVLILATVLAVGSYMIFIVLLKLQIPAWPYFITG